MNVLFSAFRSTQFSNRILFTNLFLFFLFSWKTFFTLCMTQHIFMKISMAIIQLRYKINKLKRHTTDDKINHLEELVNARINFFENYKNDKKIKQIKKVKSFIIRKILAGSNLFSFPFASHTARFIFFLLFSHD